ncbi:uncharacterized protein UV8b_04884 [Ustilaginoidea virens]|uniref:Uncharacterized protein n=1 Tax=Ustilaginoidea virens TaxID=1159556 RepID=A0A063BP71_USTVR|nr:uncharacterized protein UV8b_04884 [Ustilaginoidea virens]QUC20643.1 hypothetical protein UV8b_04884 [Ustilaginoidea virens]GAO15298.1 hypothetical protein UVI_02041210 [Ustilaginoidea virens]
MIPSPSSGNATLPAFAAATPHFLLGRAQCPGGTFPCPTSLGAVFSDICCKTDQLCTLDGGNNAACCPSGAVCTGSAPSPVTSTVPPAPTSYVTNPYYSFPYAPASLANSAACASATSACSSHYDACVTNLGGSGYGVTIDVPGGGGTTVNPDNHRLGPSATAVCSSLSSQACASLGATRCDSFSQGSAASSGRSRRKRSVAVTIAISTILPMVIASAA